MYETTRTFLKSSHDQEWFLNAIDDANINAEIANPKILSSYQATISARDPSYILITENYLTNP